MRIYPKDSKDPIKDDLESEHERYAIIQGGYGREKRRKQRVLRQLFKPNRFILFDNKQTFVIGQKVCFYLYFIHWIYSLFVEFIDYYR